MNYRKRTVKNAHLWKLNNMLLNNQQITKEINDKIKKYLEKNDNENTKSKPIGRSTSTSKRAIYSNSIISKETRKF